MPIAPAPPTLAPRPHGGPCARWPSWSAGPGAARGPAYSPPRWARPEVSLVELPLGVRRLYACVLSRPDDDGYFSPASIREPYSMIVGKPRGIDAYNPQLKALSEGRGHILYRKGAERQRRYRFSDPLMEPYVLLMGIASGRIDLRGCGRGWLPAATRGRGSPIRMVSLVLAWARGGGAPDRGRRPGRRSARLRQRRPQPPLFASSMVMLGTSRPCRPGFWLLGLGITATLAANAMRGLSHGPGSAPWKP